MVAYKFTMTTKSPQRNVRRLHIGRIVVRMEGRRPATEATAAEGTSSVDAVGTSFGRAQELLRHSRDYHAYVGGTPISGTPLATPVTSGTRTHSAYATRT